MMVNVCLLFLFGGKAWGVGGGGSGSRKGISFLEDTYVYSFFSLCLLGGWWGVGCGLMRRKEGKKGKKRRRVNK